MLLYKTLPLIALPAVCFAAPQDQVTASTIIVPGPTVTTTYIDTPTTPPSPQYTDSLILRTSLLNSTNFFRFQHNATFLAWNTTLAAYAASYVSKCTWSHSHGPEGYGENLAMGYADIISAVDAWGNERDLYTFAPPADVTGFSEETGHFTQLVWKTTTTVGCAVKACNGDGGVAGYYVVCEYWPSGNVVGTERQGGENVWFLENVSEQIHSGSEGFDEAAAIAGAGGANVTGSEGGTSKAAEGMRYDTGLLLGLLGLFALRILLDSNML